MNPRATVAAMLLGRTPAGMDRGGAGLEQPEPVVAREPISCLERREGRA